MNTVSPNGYIFKPAPRKPYVAVCLEYGGYCFRCGDIIPHVTGASVAMYSSHVCKPGRGGKPLPPIPDTSFLEPESASVTTTVISAPAAITEEQYWADVLAKLEAIPGVKSRIDLKRKKVALIMGDSVIIDSGLSPKDLIVETLVLSDLADSLISVTHQAKESYDEAQRLGTALSVMETDFSQLLKKYDSLSHAYNTEIAAARAEIERLKRRISPPPTVEIIEHSN